MNLQPKNETAFINSYLKEINLKGLDQTLVNELIQSCEGHYYQIVAYPQFQNYFNELQENHREELSQIFLATLFSGIIIRRIDWSSDYSLNLVIKGALLHEIGKKSLPVHLRCKNFENLSDSELEIYKKYPLLGYDALKNSEMPQQVKQIVYQHREWVNGHGFPNSLSGVRIFPLAKIISFADDFSTFIYKKNLAPIEGLKKFIPTQVTQSRYDTSSLNAFFMGLSQDELKIIRKL